MLEKGCLGDACGACCGGPKLPTLVVFGGRAQDKSVCAEWGVGASSNLTAWHGCRHHHSQSATPST